MNLKPISTSLLLQISGFLTLLSNGVIAVPDHVKMEATELLDKIGEEAVPKDGETP